MTKETTGKLSGNTLNTEEQRVSHQKELVREQFGRTAKAYVSSSSHGNEQALRTVVEALNPNPDWLVLDVATGGGHVAKSVAGHVRHVVASDLTKTMLTEARRHIRDDSQIANVSYVLADAENLPFLDETFDAVTCRIAPHHFPNPERFVLEVGRVLRPGGRFLLVDNVIPEEKEFADWYNTLEKLRDPSHVRCASVEEWKSWMANANLTCQSEMVSCKKFEFETWCRRMVTSEEQYQEVVDWIVTAPEPTLSYYHVSRDGHSVVSFEGLEWLAVCDKIVGGSEA